jgi:ribonucleoside-diphosphate reductase alpha subunit
MSSDICIEKRQKWTPNNNNNTKPIYEPVNILKIVNRLKYLAIGHDGLGGEDVDPTYTSKKDRSIIRIGRPLNKINYNQLAIQIVKIISDKTKSSDIDEYSIKCCLERNLESSEYGEMAARIFISNMHKETPNNLFDAIRYSFFKRTINNEHAPRIRDEILLFVANNKDSLEKIIDYKRDYLLNYFGLMTLIKPGGVAYLNKDSHGRLVERPQHLFMREAIEFHFDSENFLEKIKNTYDIVSLKYATHATPTLANACSDNPRLVSCNLLAMREDSIQGIGESIRDMMILSKNEAGIGAYMSNIRAAGSVIKSTGGLSRGLKPLFKVFEQIFNYIDQGGKRKGSAAFYLDIWHADFIDFIKMGRNTQAADEDRARSLFYGVVINDVFMRAVLHECNSECGDNCCMGTHYFMSPDACPSLIETHGEEYEKEYNQYIQEKKYVSMIHARKLMYEIIFSMINAGKIYIFNRDSANRHNNLENAGMINTSNLCCEITEPVIKKNGDKTDIISVCNLASIKLDTFIVDNYKDPVLALLYNCMHTNDILSLNVYDFDGNNKIMKFDIGAFEKTIKTIIRNLDICIDRTSYPENKTYKTNISMRPIGLGVQGLADLFIRLNIPYESDKARVLNWCIFNWIYLFAMETTVAMAEEKGPYEYFNGSPASKGILQFDTRKTRYIPSRAELCDLFVDCPAKYFDFDARYNALRGKPMRNGLLIAPMPTASTAQILGSYESFEPITSNLFTRGVLSGDFQVLNAYLVDNMEIKDIFGRNVIDNIIINNGSVANLNISNHAKNVYKTIYEVSMKRYIQLSADRAQFICQSQSLNLYWSGKPDDVKNKIYSALIYGWKQDLKTLCYYTRIQTQTGQKVVESKTTAEMSEDEFKSWCKTQKEKAELTGEPSGCDGGYCGS